MKFLIGSPRIFPTPRPAQFVGFFRYHLRSDVTRAPHVRSRQGRPLSSSSASQQPAYRFRRLSRAVGGNNFTMAEPNPAATDLASDADDDEALRVAIAMSLQDQPSPATRASATNKSPAPQRPPQSETSFSLLSLDRRGMEEERLARMARKRARSPSDDDVVEVPPPRKKSMPAPRRLDETCTDSTLPYPNGTVKRTWVRGYPRTGDDIKIEEVLQKDKLLLAILSSYQWNDEWILSKVDVAKTKLLLAAFASDDRQVRRGSAPSLQSCSTAPLGD